MTSPASASMLTPMHKYAAAALFSLALHQAQVHQTLPLGFLTDDQDDDIYSRPSEERDSNSSSADSVSDDPQLWVHQSSGLLRPVFKFLEVDSRAWDGLEETAAYSPAKHHVGAVSSSFSSLLVVLSFNFYVNALILVW